MYVDINLFYTILHTIHLATVPVLLLLLITKCYFVGSENCSTAVNIFNCQGLLPCLVSCLESDVYPTTVAIPAGKTSL